MELGIIISLLDIITHISHKCMVKPCIQRSIPVSHSSPVAACFASLSHYCMVQEFDNFDKQNLNKFIVGKVSRENYDNC